jgi:hypothetical protein
MPFPASNNSVLSIGSRVVTLLGATSGAAIEFTGMVETPSITNWHSPAYRAKRSCSQAKQKTALSVRNNANEEGGFV